MFIFNYCIKYSIHIGHSIINTPLLTTWFLYKFRKPIWIINIFKTVLFLKIIFRFLFYLINSNLSFWFANLDITKEFLFKNLVNQCGEFLSSQVWIRGFLSNFKSVQNSMNKYILKRYIIKSIKKNYLINNWFITRFTWPRGIFLSNIKSNYIIAKEASSMKLPIVAIVDTILKIIYLIYQYHLMMIIMSLYVFY